MKIDRPSSNGLSANSPSWVQIEGRRLLADGAPVHLRGIGLGNWMLVEHFMIGLPQVDYMMRQAFEDVLGHERASAFWDAYMESYFSEGDFAQIRGLGFNHVRLPFSYRHLESDSCPGEWREEGFRMIDRVIDWCRQHGLWVLLDLHSAPGCQASDWNAESAYGEVHLWDDAACRERVVRLWGEIARRYRNEPTVLGYEILNEPVTVFPHHIERLNEFHHRCIRIIREVDAKHIIVVNGDKHATELSALDDATFADPQVMAAFHFYHQFTPPLREITTFPCMHGGRQIDADFVINETGLRQRADGERIPRPQFLNEFGFNYWTTAPGAQRGITGAILDWCESNGVHWNLWHWKDVRGMGLLSMRENAPWLKLLDRIGARRLQVQSDDAVDAYLSGIDTFLPLEDKRRSRLQMEARRDLEIQTLWHLVERMRHLRSEELAELGASFGSANFAIDEPMADILRSCLGRNALEPAEMANA